MNSWNEFKKKLLKSIRCFVLQSILNFSRSNENYYSPIKMYKLFIKMRKITFAFSKFSIICSINVVKVQKWLEDVWHLQLIFNIQIFKIVFCSLNVLGEELDPYKLWMNIIFKKNSITFLRLWSEIIQSTFDLNDTYYKQDNKIALKFYTSIK